MQVGCKNDLSHDIELFITKLNRMQTHPCKLGPIEPYLYSKTELRFTGVYILFLNFVQNRDCGYLLEPPS